VFSFTTIPAPGDCPINAVTQVAFEDSIESGANGWTTSAAVGTTNFSISTTQASSPTHSWWGPDAVTVTDLSLTSPAVTLPAATAAPLTLEFHHWRNLEPRSADGCYDGGVLEIALNGGAFTAVPGAQLLTDPYTGAITTAANPLNGRQAWCGVVPFKRSVVDLSPYAGQSARVRFRVATDDSVGRDGWFIDDVKIKGCGASDVIFANGFDN